MFLLVILWFSSLISNEFRQFILAKKNNDVKDSYLTTTISGNTVDIMSLLFIFIGFILHGASFYVYEDEYPLGSAINESTVPLIIHPQFDVDQFIAYCPFYLPKYLVYAQACFI